MTALRALVAAALVSTSAAAAGTDPEPEGPITLAEALKRVVEQSPALAAERWSIRAAEERRAHAGAFGNPELTVVVEDAFGTGDYAGLSQSQITLELGQVIELGGKRRGRRAVAESAEEEARRAYELRRVEVASEATLAFIHVVADQQRVALTQKARVLAEAALEAAERRVRSGGISAVEEQRARILVARTRIVEEHIQHELLSSRRRLAATWGSDHPRFAEAKADLFARGPLPPFEELAARIDRNPELRRLASERARRTAALDAARRRALPDARVFAGARRLEGPDATSLLGGVSIPLPVSSRNQGEIGEARALRARADDEIAAARLELLTALFAEYQELAHVSTALVALEEDVIPAAESMLATVEDGFRLGRFSQLELIDAQRTLIDVRNEHIDAAEEYHSFVVRLEALLGEPLRAPATGPGETK